MSKYLTIRRVDGGVIVHDGDEHIFTDSVDLAEFCVNWFYGYEAEDLAPLKKGGEHLIYCDKCGDIAREVFSGDYCCDNCNRAFEGIPEAVV